jgi:hypothetical protein
MRAPSRRWFPVLFAFGLLPDVAAACSILRHEPGTPINVPRAVFEGRVVAVKEIEIYVRANRTTPGQETIIEVVHSFHGPYRVGERVATRQITMASMCGTSVGVGTRVQVWSDQDSDSLSLAGVLYEDSEEFSGPFAELAKVSGVARSSAEPALAGMLLRGDIDDREAASLMHASKLEARESCEVVRSGNHAQVGCGTAYGGNDARVKVLFERVRGSWIEVMRYAAPSPDAASATRTS